MLGVARSVDDADPMAGARRRGTAAKQQTSNDLCHEDVWALQWSARSYQSESGIDRARAGQYPRVGNSKRIGAGSASTRRTTVERNNIRALEFGIGEVRNKPTKRVLSLR
jgi:hypothetical protein